MVAARPIFIFAKENSLLTVSFSLWRSVALHNYCPVNLTSIACCVNSGYRFFQSKGSLCYKAFLDSEKSLSPIESHSDSRASSPARPVCLSLPSSKVRLTPTDLK